MVVIAVVDDVAAVVGGGGVEQEHHVEQRDPSTKLAVPLTAGEMNMGYSHMLMLENFKVSTW